MNFFQKMGRALSKMRRKLQDGFVRQLDKMINMGLRNQIAVGIILFGIGVIIYAVIIPFYIKYQNEKYVKMAREAMEEILNAEGEGLDLSKDENLEKIGMTREEYEGLSAEDQARLQAQLEKDKMVRTTLNGQAILGILKIEKLGLEYAIVEGTKGENIRVAVGHIEQTAPIGGDGNCVIAGHRGGYYGEFFKHIDQLEEGDFVQVTDLTGQEYTYSVYRQEVVKPKDWTITEMVVGEKTLTLLSCEDSGTKRLAVVARMVEITKDEKTGEEKITVVKSLATPTPEPTPEPTPTPGPTAAPIQDVSIVNDYFGDVVYTGKTDAQGNWNASLPNGTYTVTLRNSLGEEQVTPLMVGDGVTDATQQMYVDNMGGQTVWIGKTDAAGNYDIPTDGWMPGTYTIRFVNIFGKETRTTFEVTSSFSDSTFAE